MEKPQKLSGKSILGIAIFITLICLAFIYANYTSTRGIAILYASEIYTIIILGAIFIPILVTNYLESLLDLNKYKYGIWSWTIVIIIFTIYYISNSFKYNYLQYAYACPTQYASKCYKVLASLYTDADDESSWEMVEKITFPNTGSIYFDYCEGDRQNKFTCYEEDGNAWKIDIAEIEKVRKK